MLISGMFKKGRTTFKLFVIKPAYLKNPSKPRSITTDAIRMIFLFLLFEFDFSINIPAI